MLDQWAVFLEPILGPPSGHPMVHELLMIIEAEAEVSAHLWAKIRLQP